MAEFSDQGNAIDNHLRNTEADTVRGTNIDWQVGEHNAVAQTNRTLIKWDLSSIGATQEATGGTMTVYARVSSTSDNNRQIQLYRVRRAWETAGATWNSWKSGNAWSTAGVGDTTNDREATGVGSVTVASDIASETAVEIPLGTQALTDMINGDFTNNGWLIQADTENADLIAYHSSENGTVAQCPKLVVTHQTAPVSSESVLNLTSKTW